MARIGHPCHPMASLTGQRLAGAVDAAAAPLLGRPLPLHVGFGSDRVRALLGSAVEATALGARAGRLDAAVVEAGSRAQVELARQAKEHGAVVVGIGASDGDDQTAFDLRIGAGVGGPPPVLGAPAVDVSRFNPTAFARVGVGGFWAVLQPGASPDGIRSALPLLEGGAAHEPVALVGEGIDELPLPAQVVLRQPFAMDTTEGIELLHKRLGVLDHSGFHASAWERAGWIARLCAAGLPVVCAELDPELRALLGAELAGLLEGLGARELTDLDHRERLSVALRRAALRNHSQTERWRQIAAATGLELPERPLISVIFATRRVDWLEHGLAQVNRQSYAPRELVVCLHGEEFPQGIEERVRELAQGELKIVHVDAELTLGDALNAGVEAASGELVTKMDDDDYYNTDHLWDLVLALEYSGADLVGKAAEFVYLAQIDVTVRQISHDVETRLAGGGMMMRRAPLVEEGGWPQRTRAEDLALIRSYDAAGRPIHRIPPHGYILNRHGRDHTWRPAVDYFLFRSEGQWRGLRFDVTAID
jgi:hypothetical protein